MKNGIFCISIDLELMWGRKDMDHSKFINKVKKERVVIEKLLKLFKKYNIPATWAAVGKLSEKDKKWSGPLWYGKDIINWIRKDKIHEIGSHSYSHEIFTEISKEKAEEEIKKNKTKSFVFPRNQIKYLELLKKYNFTSYRGKDKSEYELLIPRVPPTSSPKKEKGLIEIPSSMYFVSSRGPRKNIPYGIRLLKSKLGIKRAIKKKEIFHIWFHPTDFAIKTEPLLKEFEEILKFADEKRSEGLLDIKTMDQIAKTYK